MDTPGAPLQVSLGPESNRNLRTSPNDGRSAPNVRVGRLFRTHRGGRTVPGVNGSRKRQRVNLRPNGALQLLEIAPRQVGPTHTPGKQRITHKRSRKISEVEKHVSRAVPRDMANFHLMAQHGESLALCHPTIHVNRLQIHAFTHELLHHFRRFDQNLVGSMSQHTTLGFTNHFRATLGMIPMAVGDPKFS